jgi:hypothetical protein
MPNRAISSDPASGTQGALLRQAAPNSGLRCPREYFMAATCPRARANSSANYEQ